MFARFTDEARRAIVDAQSEARLMRHPSIGPEHLLLGLMHDEESLPAQLLAAERLGLADARARVRRLHEAVTIPDDIHIPFTPSATKVLRDVPGNPQVDGVHLLWAITRPTGGSARSDLRNLGVDLDALEKKLEQRLGDLTG